MSALVPRRAMTYIPFMRALLTALLVLAAASLAPAADLKIERVWPSYRTVESFDRIGEFFGKPEDAEAKLIFRSQPAARAGHYFLTRIKNSGPAIANARIELDVVTPAAPEPKTYTFSCTVPAGSNALNFGLTGTDWPHDPNVQTVAWQLRVLASDGTELAKAQSFLWAMPEKK